MNQLAQNLICQTAFLGLEPEQIQDRLRNLGTLRLLLSSQYSGNFTTQFAQLGGSVSQFVLSYNTVRCEEFDVCYDACNMPGGLTVNSLKRITVDRNNLDCVATQPFTISKAQIKSYCGANNTGGIAEFSRAFSAQFRDVLKGMYVKLNRKLATDIWNYAQSSYMPSISGAGTTATPLPFNTLVQMPTGYIYNAAAETPLRVAYEKRGLSFDGKILLGGTGLEYLRQAKMATMGNDILNGIDRTKAASVDLAMRAFLDYTYDDLAQDGGAMLAIDPKMFHLITYSDKLEGYGDNSHDARNVGMSFAEMARNAGSIAPVIERLIGGANGYFGDTETDQVSTVMGIDNSLGFPLVYEVMVKKRLCGDFQIGVKIQYKLVRVPVEDVVCGVPGYNGISRFVACLPTLPTNCTNQTPTPAASLLCVTPTNPDACYRFQVGDLVQVLIDGTPLPSQTVSGNIVADTPTAALILLSNLLGSAQVAGVNAANGVIMQTPAQATATLPIIDGTVIQITSTCSPAPLVFTVGLCDPQPLQLKQGSGDVSEIVPENKVKVKKTTPEIN